MFDLTKLGGAGAAAVLALTLTACGSGGSDSSDPPVQIEAPTPGKVSVTQVGVPYAEKRQLMLAQEKLIEECMKKAGHQYSSQPISETQRDRSWTRSDDVAKAKKEGYGVLDRLKESNSEMSRQGRRANPDLAGLTPDQQRAYHTALNGTKKQQVDDALGGKLEVQTSGCYAESTRKLYGDPVEWGVLSFLADNFQGVSQTTAIESSEVKAVTRKWSACMAGEGYHFKDREAAIASITYGRQGGADQPVRDLPETPSRQEIDTAVADAECDREVGLSSTAEKIIKATLNENLRKHESDLLRYREKQQKALTTAADILK